MERLTTPDDIRFERAKKRVKEIKGFYKHLTIYILVNAFLLTLTYIKMKPSEVFFEFSTFSTLFFWGLGLLFHAINVFGRNAFLGQDWEEKKIKEFMDKGSNSSKWE